MYNKILVPLDGSKRAEQILPQVEALALCFLSKVFLLQVVRSPLLNASEELDILLYRQKIEQRVKDAKSYLARIEGEFKKIGIDVQAFVVQGPVIKTIIKMADCEEVDLIAMASHRRNGLSRVFFSSVAAGVLSQVDRPLLLLRSRESKILSNSTGSFNALKRNIDKNISISHPN